MRSAVACVVVVVVVVLGFVASAGAAPAEGAPHTAHIELTQTASGGKSARTTRVAVALVVDGAPSKVSARLGEAQFEVDVQMFTRKDASLVAVRVEGSGPRNVPSVQLSATTRPEVGKRVVLSRVAGADGSQFEIAMTIN